MVKIKIEVNGTDISETFKEHFISLEVTDMDGTESDELNIVIANKIKRPSYEDKIKLWIKDIFYGLYLVQESTTNNANTLQIRATGTNFSNNMKVKKNKSWSATSLNSILKEKATENGLLFKVGFSDVSIANIIQSNESDLHFLNRLAKEYDAIFGTKNNTLIFIERGDELPTFTVNINDCTLWSISHIAKKRYGSCRAIWRDTKENKKLSITYGNSEPTIVLNGHFKDEKEAILKAKAKLENSNRGTKQGTLSKQGEYFSAGSKLNIINSKQDDGIYTIKSVYTTVDNYGFRVNIDFEN